MRGVIYQLKNIRRDKMCILTFLLPIFAGIVINLISGADFQSISETSFGILKDDLSDEAVAWLEVNGSITEYESMDDLREAVKEPSTQMTGVLKAGNGIKTLRCGDELEINKVIADTLPQLYAGRTEKEMYDRTVIPVSSDDHGLKSLLIAITLVTAMFMGCTFNAMNIIGEKEDGVAFVNQVLPMTGGAYIAQKIILGLTGSAVSAVITAFICIRTKAVQVSPVFLLIGLSAYLSALMGLFIGRFSKGLMSGIVYIKIIMILFLAPPVFFYLTLPAGSMGAVLSCLLPSCATFYGLMDLLNGQTGRIWSCVLILAAHDGVWSTVYGMMEKRKRD